MNSLFLTKLDLKENEGIYKKIISEAISLSKLMGKCYFIQRKNNGTKVLLIEGESIVEERIYSDSIFIIAKRICCDCLIDFVYIRHMIPCFKLVSFLKYLNRKNVRIAYEIPTYPYFYEQFKISRNKLRAFIKLALDLIFMPSIYRFIDNEIVVLSNSKKRIKKKMIVIHNGMDVSKSKKPSSQFVNSPIKMVAVGTIYPYHGYDLLIKSFEKYQYKNRFEIHFYGASYTLDELSTYVKRKRIPNIYFHGTIDNAELLSKYSEYDLGIGCLALFRRKANIDTTLKVAEYMTNGLPVLSSGRLFSYSSKLDEFNIMQKSIDFDEICLRLDDLKARNVELFELANREFSWDNVMKEILRKMGVMNE